MFRQRRDFLPLQNREGIQVVCDGLLLFFIPHQRLVVFHVLKFQGRLEIQHRRLQHLLLRILGQVLLIAACRMEHRLNNRYRYSMCAQSLI